MSPFSDRWRAAVPPSLADIEALARDAFARLPEQFRAMCQDLVIRVEDFPSDEVVEAMNLESEFDLLGLFQGVGLPFQSELAPTHMPNMIWLYRRPILDYWAEHDDSLTPSSRTCWCTRSVIISAADDDMRRSRRAD